MISVLYNIILITNFKLIEMCIKSSPAGEGRREGLRLSSYWATPTFFFLSFLFLLFLFFAFPLFPVNVYI